MKREGAYMYEDDVEIMYHYYCSHQLYNTFIKIPDEGRSLGRMTRMKQYTDFNVHTYYATQ